MPDPDWWHALWPRPVEVLERLGIEPDAEVVDLCCGDGFFTIPLARMVRHVAAIDLDPAMLALARDRAFAEGLTNCTFTVGDAYDLANLVPGHVDSRVCSHLVSRTDWYQKTFASIRRGTIRFSSATGGHQPQWTGRLDHSGMSGSIGWELQPEGLPRLGVVSDRLALLPRDLRPPVDRAAVGPSPTFATHRRFWNFLAPRRG